MKVNERDCIPDTNPFPHPLPMWGEQNTLDVPLERIALALESIAGSLLRLASPPRIIGADPFPTKHYIPELAENID